LCATPPRLQLELDVVELTGLIAVLPDPDGNLVADFDLPARDRMSLPGAVVTRSLSS